MWAGRCCCNGTSRAIHVHQFGDLSQGCDSTGPHYNPMSVPHPQHPGDFGNFAVRDGQVWKYRSGLAASLTGPHSIAGRAVVWLSVLKFVMPEEVLLLIVKH